MKKSVLFIVPMLVMLFGMSACKNNEPAGPTDKAKYTVILYANGGENLDYLEERDISEAAAEIAKKKDDLSVRFIVFMKYSSQKGLDKQNEDMMKNQGKAYVPGGQAGKVYFYEAGPACIDFNNTKDIQCLSLPDKWIADESDAPMYDPKYMADVFKNVAKSAPAENYILVLSGHAAGWEPNDDGDYPKPANIKNSAITDAFFDGRAIKAKELHDGIQQSGLHFSAVIFDCCLQNSIEYLSELTDVTTYTLASGHTTHGGDYSALVQELYAAPQDQDGLKKALSRYAEVYAKNHKEDWEDGKSDKVLMNVDFAVAEMAKMPAVWTSLKSIVDYMCANLKDSAAYTIPSRQCYHYYNASPQYDLVDYLDKMKKDDGAPYANDTAYQQLFNDVYYAMDNAIVYHAYALHYVSNLPDDTEAPKLSMNINLGAKGRIQASFQESEDHPSCYQCYDSEGKEWYFNPTATPTWSKGTNTNVEYEWQYSYGKSIFDQKTGWTRWLKLNPVLPYGNPPIDDDGDTNE